MTDPFAILIATAVVAGFVHTAFGPDHYLPFVALARARRWSTGTAMAVTALCGLGHVLSSALLGVIGIAGGAAVFPSPPRRCGSRAASARRSIPRRSSEQ